MTDLGAYSFLPWARQGLGSKVQEADQAAVPGIRPSIAVTLRVTADRVGGGTTTEQVPRRVDMYGPGDILGIDAASIVRTEPRHWITNFETNYLPYVEFYEEDFPWRYTPAKASDGGRRMRPWLTLAVLAEDEFEDRAPLAEGALPAIDVADPTTTFPAWATMWAWAHVHVNGALGGDSADQTGNATRLGAVVGANRDSAYSRLLSPRILRPNTAYHAFVVPSFESGRLAGLKKDPSGAAFPTQGAWVPGRTDPDPNLFPVYHRWFFRTGAVGDFEYLVRLLQPRTVDPQVGRRPIDVRQPGSNLPPIPELGGVLRLGGALRAPLATLSDDDRAEYEQHMRWGAPYPHAFQRALAKLVNLAVDYRTRSAADANAATALPVIEDDDDPVIVPPLYGRWHAQVSRLTAADADPDHDRWVDELNLDPRHRAAAGLGTRVVQHGQETLMEAAWQQVGKVLDANARIRFGQMAVLTSKIWHQRELSQLASNGDTTLLSITAPVHARVLTGGTTAAYAIKQSTVPRALLGTTMRTMTRPRSRVVRLGTRTRPVAFDDLVTRVNDGEVSAAPPKEVADAVPTGRELADDIGGSGGGTPPSLPPVLDDLLRRVRRWRIWYWVLAAVLVVLLYFVPVVGPALTVALVIAVIVLFLWLDRRAQPPPVNGARVLDPDTRTSASVDELPASSAFATVPVVVTATGVSGEPPAVADGPDSVTATRFKEALRNLYRVDEHERLLPVRVRGPLALDDLIATTFTAIDPKVTIPRRVFAGVEIPGRIAGDLVEHFGEVMVYPEIDTPMYEPLEALSSEFLLPNIQLLQVNSITLLETNQKFIESYMVGLNHEFARELMWREYPTDQRGSYFRQFWDVTGFLAEPTADPATLRERLRDIPELHRWSRASGLDEHDHREVQGDKEDEVVLAIRGELLKKYPTAVVYAHRAAWEPAASGGIDRTKPRRLAELPAGVLPRDLVKTPLYEAKVDPDIYFFGFDLTAESARGGQVVAGEEDPGWFFVIKERPGEPRFGLDLPLPAAQSVINTWNELAWTDVMNDYDTATVLPVGAKPVSLDDPGAGAPDKAQYDEDQAFRWRADTNAAELAYILYQVPVLVAVHAAEMLAKGT